MSKRDKEELLQRLLSDATISEDLADALTVIQRHHEKAIPWEAVENRLCH